MVLRELSELHAAVIFITGYTDGSWRKMSKWSRGR